MDLSNFKKIKPGQTFFIVCNTGTAGIFEYQYLGIFKEHLTSVKKHLFISPYFLSTVCVNEGKENLSRNIKNICLTNESAEKRKKQLKKEENY